MFVDGGIKDNLLPAYIQRMASNMVILQTLCVQYLSLDLARTYVQRSRSPPTSRCHPSIRRHRYLLPHQPLKFNLHSTRTVL